MATKSTKLDAVNIILSNIGQSPVTSLVSGSPMVEMAELILDEITRTCLSEGWTFNTEKEYPFTPDPNGEIVIPENILSMDGNPYSRDQLVLRGGKLYNRRTHSFKFDKPQMLDVVWLEEFVDCPEAFKNYITIRAANVFAGRSVGTAEAVRFGQQEEAAARAAVMEYETQDGDYSIFQDPEGNNVYPGYNPYLSVIRF